MDYELSDNCRGVKGNSVICNIKNTRHYVKELTT